MDFLYRLESIAFFNSYSKESKQQSKLYDKITKLIHWEKNGETYFTSDKITDLLASYFNYQIFKNASCSPYQNLYGALSTT